ncbi:2-keto-4-pentenoate hydratase [Streptomyces albaduncus]|uniref:2-keto-4-pentenoate hydratase n=1 Tax=Streptomyces griseoloalbus TaxID=67303 RepID=A0A7W8BHZ3_9ACTN|nr:2-keto-4-pentenoate hydratase [Streptomyces albaduncus]
MAGALAVCGLAFAPTAAAVAPGTATVNADCGSWGGGQASLTATQSGTSATVTISTSAVTAPVALGQDSLVSELTLVKAGGGKTVFKGTKNPAMAVGSALKVGPLTGTVASGDSLEAFGGTLKVTAFGFITITCTATGPQAPGPFVFD